MIAYRYHPKKSNRYDQSSLLAVTNFVLSFRVVSVHSQKKTISHCSGQWYRQSISIFRCQHSPRYVEIFFATERQFSKRFTILNIPRGKPVLFALFLSLARTVYWSSIADCRNDVSVGEAKQDTHRRESTFSFTPESRSDGCCSTRLCRHRIAG